MKKAIVTTTINEPTLATKMYAAATDWDLIVVGDTKTPHESYADLDCVYLDPKTQEDLDKTLSDMIGWKSIQRRNMGFLYALRKDYDMIATVDDDNIPLTGWGEDIRVDVRVDNVPTYSTDFGFFDPLSVTNYPHLWHRGFPLQHVHKKNRVTRTVKSGVFDVQANLWNGDPDIDAVCRMVHAPDCTFEGEPWFTSTCLTPFNSQNTILTRQALTDYFMFPGVGRMDDIFGSYMLQKKGYKVLYGPATVRQDRNEHDLTVDMVKEYIGYENVKNLLDDTSFIPMDAYNRYLELTHAV
jgi:hypothetical protein